MASPRLIRRAPLRCTALIITKYRPLELVRSPQTTVDNSALCGKLLPRVHLAPTFPQALFSVPQACDNGQAVLFHPEDGVLILDIAHLDWSQLSAILAPAIVMRGKRSPNGSFALAIPLPAKVTTPSSIEQAAFAKYCTSAAPKTYQDAIISVVGRHFTTTPDFDTALLVLHARHPRSIDKLRRLLYLWHCRLGHPNPARFHTLFPMLERVTRTDLEAYLDCAICKEAKSKEQPHRHMGSTSRWTTRSFP